MFGEQQFLRGYALLLPDPVVGTLNALTGSARRIFLEDMARLGDEVLAATGALRINYAMFGNVEPALHARFDAARDAALLAAVRSALGIVSGAA